MRVLIIGNLSGAFSAASQIASKRGAKVKQAATLAVALEALRSGVGADVILLDVKADIGSLKQQLESEHIHIPIIACGFDHNAEEAVEAIRAGAKEYLPLPPDEELIAAILESIAGDKHVLLGKSPSFLQVLSIADQVAPSDATILITGQSGTGKEVMAHYIHSKSKRSSQVFIAVNCAAIPDNLLESELFGHEKGAFTGAIARRIGKFEEAQGGTLLLDEISEIDIRLQAKLLRALQERQIDRIGGGRPVPVDIRIIATSNRDLKQEVKEGRFREDLFFRLNIIELSLPPLADRKEDIVAFSEFFAQKYSALNGMACKAFSQEAKDALCAYPWPGNVRELENTVHRSILLSRFPEIEAQALMLPQVASHASGEEQAAKGLVGRTLESVERDLIVDTVRHCAGDPNQAASLLGISLKNLMEKLVRLEN